MRCLVTGATSRQCNPEASLRDVSFSHLLAQALRAAGHEVEHRNPSVTEDMTKFDRVIVGMAPLHALGSNRAYGALSAILRTWGTDKLMILLDDPDTGKIFSGIKTMCENPDRLTKPFFAYKLEYNVATQPEWKKWLNDGVRVLRDSPWPATIVPQHAWAGTPRLTGAGTQLPELVGVDPSSLIDYALPSPWTQRKPVWTVEAPEKSAWLDSQRPFIRLPVERHGTGGLPRFTKDSDRLENYVAVRGVIAPPVCNGNWWTPRPWMASLAGALVLTNWQSVRDLGHAWTMTAEQADQLSDADLPRITSEQNAAITEAVPSAHDISRAVLGV